MVEERFMSAGFELVVIGAPLLQQQQLWLSSSFSSFLTTSVFFVRCMLLLCCFQQSINLCFPSASMRLRPRRTCSGVVCFGGFHIKRFQSLFLFLRGPLT